MSLLMLLRLIKQKALEKGKEIGEASGETSDTLSEKEEPMIGTHIKEVIDAFKEIRKDR